MIGLVSTAWLLASIAGVVFIVRPKRDWPVVANRRRAAAVFAVIFIGGPPIIELFAPAGAFDAPRPRAQRASVVETPAQLAAAARARADEQARAVLRDMRGDPAKYLDLEQTTARKGGLDLVFFLSGEIHSTSKLDVKDPVIQCDLYSETKTPLGHVREKLFKFVRAGQSTAFEEFNMGFADSRWGLYACRVDSATVLAPS